MRLFERVSDGGGGVVARHGELRERDEIENGKRQQSELDDRIQRGMWWQSDLKSQFIFAKIYES